MNISTVTQKLLKVPVIGTILSVLLIRSIIFEPGFPLALIAIALIGLYAFLKHLDTKKIPEVNKRVQADLEKLQAELAKVSLNVGMRRSDYEQKTIKRSF